MSNNQIEQLKPKVPINNAHMHSKIDPLKEAEVFCDRYEEEIYANTHLVVFGVAQGYHLTALIKKIKSIRPEVHLFCIDPNRIYVEQYIHSHADTLRSIDIHFSGQSQKNLFASKNFVHFLTEKPAILVHKTSYDQNKEYYKEILTYRPAQRLYHYKRQIQKDIALILDDEISAGKTLHEILNVNETAEKLNFKTTFLSILKNL